jgi:carbamoyl-phosphate synthase large subunit
LVEGLATLDLCLDKIALIQACCAFVPVPFTVVLDAAVTQSDLGRLGTPFIVKPRTGSGAPAVLDSVTELDYLPRDATLILQEFLPGTEYSIDVLARADGHIVASVPRRRDTVENGVVVAGRTVRNDELEDFGRVVAGAIGTTGVLTVLVRRAKDGVLKLLSVTPTFPPTMPLTIAAGVDMPLLATNAAFGVSLPARIGFAEVAVVRHLTDVHVPLDEYGAVSATELTVGVRSLV